MIGSANEELKIYLNKILTDQVREPADPPPLGLLLSNQTIQNTSHSSEIEPASVQFEIKDQLIQTQLRGCNENEIVRLVQLQDSIQNIVTIQPSIVDGEGIVQIYLRFEDLLEHERGLRWFGIVDSNFPIRNKYDPQEQYACASFCGDDGNIVHASVQTSLKCIFTGKQYKNGDIVMAEVNMGLDREQRTLHFFVGDTQMPISFKGLPSSIKFFVHRRDLGTSVSILRMQKVTVAKAVQNQRFPEAFQW
ncbi:MAG: hypothetical protein EZS28_008098 [Streblomastix strix]|uniref:SPRY domain-containing protein n=1 Tax=Streblomastix strix TaxID=222440 RepID=A0A5J4WMT1_9EUKA|nr:MAG: hypothetical protein EZS28_008098 [Streblomastix strix]